MDKDLLEAARKRGFINRPRRALADLHRQLRSIPAPLRLKLYPPPPPKPATDPRELSMAEIAASFGSGLGDDDCDDDSFSSLDSLTLAYDQDTPQNRSTLDRR